MEVTGKGEKYGKVEGRGRYREGRVLGTVRGKYEKGDIEKKRM